MSPEQILERELRQSVASNSRIFEFLQWVAVDGIWYPNPVAFAAGPIELKDRLALRGVVGNIHGDLHGLNVLVRPSEDESEYYLIDLAFYEDDSYLFFDQAYFEISHLLGVREHLPTSEFLRLVHALDGTVPAGGDDVGLVALVGGIRSSVADWIEKTEPNRLSYLESQAMLARVAVGLNFTHKRVSDAYKSRALLYAMANLKTYLGFHDIDWPKDPVSVRLPEA